MMKKVLIIMFSLLLLTGESIRSQNLVTKSTDRDSSVDTEIKKTLNENKQLIEKVKEIKRETQKEMEEVEQLKEKRKDLLHRVVDKVGKVLQKDRVNKVGVKTKYIYPKKSTKDMIIDLDKVPVDSTCVKTQRPNAFSKKKCVEWEYFKTITNDNNDKTVIKLIE